MTTFIACFISLVRGTHSTFHHACKIKLPPVMHQVLEDEYIRKFKEVFVIGDVHGCYDELIKLLNDAKVTDGSTLKIFVGDLVNKGPKNHEVVELLRNNQSSMLSVRGNHDEVVLREYFSAQEPGYKLAQENLWIKDLPKEDIDYLNNLPYTITIPTLKAIVVHAGLVPGIPLRANDPEKMTNMRNLVVRDYFGEGGIQAVNHAQVGVPWASLWGGPEHVYFGHDAKRLLQEYSYATGLDTGCVYGNWLTGIFISGSKKRKLVQLKAMKTHQKPKDSSTYKNEL